MGVRQRAGWRTDSHVALKPRQASTHGLRAHSDVVHDLRESGVDLLEFLDHASLADLQTGQGRQESALPGRRSHRRLHRNVFRARANASKASAGLLREAILPPEPAPLLRQACADHWKI